MQIRVAKKIGLFTAISMLIASVIGIGIFLRNGGIFSLNDNNAIGILLTWGIGTITSLATAYSFAEVSSSAKGKAGIGGWAESLIGKKFGYFVKFTFPLFYLSVSGANLAFFTGDAFFVLIGQEDLHFGWIGLFTVGIGIFIFIVNYYSIKTSGALSIVANISKFIPIAVIIVTSIVFAFINKSGGFFNPSTIPDYQHQEEVIIIGEINIIGLLAAVPSVLYAFDSFLVVGNLSDDIIKPKRNVPIAIILGIVICAIIYILITITQMLAANGNALSFFENIIPNFNQSFVGGLTAVMNIIILIAIIGVLNTIVAGTIRGHSIIVNTNVTAYSGGIKTIARKVFKGFQNENSTGFIISLIFFLFYWTILMIPSSLVGSNGNDHYVDWVSNFSTLFFFLIYAIVITAGLANRFTKKANVVKVKGFVFASILAISFTVFVFSYSFFYTNIVEPIIDPNAIKDTLGLFHEDKLPSGDGFGFITNREGALIFLAYFLWFITMPFINLGFRKLLKMESLFN